jgi:hypothetical protein
VSITRADILVAVHMASRYIARPSEKLWLWLTRILRYLKGTMHLGLIYRRSSMEQGGSGQGGPLRYVPAGVGLLSGAADSSFADGPKGKTTLGFCLLFCGNLVEYDTKLSTRVLDSSTDAECTALVLLGHSNSWWRDFLKEFRLFTVNTPTGIKEDNTSAIILTGHGSAKRSRHFDIAFYKLKDTVQFGVLALVKVPTQENEADFFTKTLPFGTFVRHRDAVMGSLHDQGYFERKATGDQIGVGPRAPCTMLAYTQGPRQEEFGLSVGSLEQPVRDHGSLEVSIPTLHFVRETSIGGGVKESGGF